jgi:hypothetical protein
MSELHDVQTELQQALTASAKAQEQLDQARLKLAPMEATANEAADLVNKLIRRFQVLTKAEVSGPTTKKKRILKPYNITPESKIGRVGKAAYTRAINAGAPEKEAKAAQKSAEAALKAKLGVA